MTTFWKKAVLAVALSTGLSGCVLAPAGPPPAPGYYGYAPAYAGPSVDVDIGRGWGHGGWGHGGYGRRW